jgi:hypothetical protein
VGVFHNHHHLPQKVMMTKNTDLALARVIFFRGRPLATSFYGFCPLIMAAKQVFRQSMTIFHSWARKVTLQKSDLSLGGFHFVHIIIIIIIIGIIIL